MPFLTQQDADALRVELEQGLGGDVTLMLVGPSAVSPPERDLTPQIRQLYSELAALSTHIRLEYVDLPTPEQRVRLGLEPDDIGPLTLLGGKAKGKVRFLGAPAGHEFPGLVRALIDVSRGESGLTPKSREALAAVASPVRIKVFFTPT